MTMTLLLAFLRANWKPLIVGLIVGAFALFWHHRGYLAGVHKSDKAIAALRDQVVTDSHRLADAAEAFRQIAAIEVANKAAADAQARAGQDALHQSQAQAVRDVARLRGDLARTRAAYRGNVCAGQALPEGVGQ